MQVRLHDLLLVAAGAMLAHLAFIVARRGNRGPADVQQFDRGQTPLRLLRKAETVLSRRRASLVLVIERASESHAFSAVLRTAEALGVQSVWLVAPPSVGKTTNPAAHATYAKHAERFLTIRSFGTPAECIAAMREDGRTVWATELSSNACVLAATAPWVRSGRGPARLALVMGTDTSGTLSAELRAAAHRFVCFPVHGFSGPLPLSVAAALCMHVTLNLLADVDAGHGGRLADSEKQALRRTWYVERTNFYSEL
jgi:tRNA G18 (ribose-2'-O)-methylase SpoU